MSPATHEQGFLLGAAGKRNSTQGVCLAIAWVGNCWASTRRFAIGLLAVVQSIVPWAESRRHGLLLAALFGRGVHSRSEEVLETSRRNFCTPLCEPFPLVTGEMWLCGSSSPRRQLKLTSTSERTHPVRGAQTIGAANPRCPVFDKTLVRRLRAALPDGGRHEALSLAGQCGCLSGLNCSGSSALKANRDCLAPRKALRLRRYI